MGGNAMTIKIYKIHPDYYPDFQKAVDAAFKDTLIKSGRCKHIFPPEIEIAEDGYIYLHVKDWVASLEGMDSFLTELIEVE